MFFSSFVDYWINGDGVVYSIVNFIDDVSKDGMKVDIMKWE